MIFSNSFNLSTLNGTNGFRMTGLASNDRFGYSVSSAGDINGDGKADLIVGAYGVSNSKGEAYVIFGASSFSSGSFNITTLNGANGFRMAGLLSSDTFGYSVSRAGDINGDGKDDIIVGAYSVSSSKGEAYVIFGASSFSSGYFNIDALNGANGFRMTGLASNDRFGISVSSAGDINGDGKADLIVGASGVSLDNGEAYVIFGASSFGSGSFNIAALNGTNGFNIAGLVVGDWFGGSLSSAGDINSDGKDDLIVGAQGVSNSTGEAYVIFGASSFASGSFNLSALNGNNGFRMTGLVMGDWLGGSVSSAGDVNGDGKDDLIVGADGASNYKGEAFVVLDASIGGSSCAAALDDQGAFNITTLNGTNGFKMTGLVSRSYGYFGSSVSTAGDVNGDGKDDIIVGARGISRLAGEAYVIFGASSFASGFFNIATLNGANGFKMSGLVSYGYFGSSVSRAGDINGDGKDDIIVGAGYLSSNTGEAYVIFGASSFSGSFNIAALNGANGFRMAGLEAGDYFGVSVSGAGDINGDGKDDIIVGACGVSSNKGEAYVIFGASSFGSGFFNITTLNGANGFKMSGLASNDYFGCAVSGAGDVNDDGKDDIIVGAYGVSSSNGEAYVIFGASSFSSGSFNIATLNGANGFKMTGLVSGRLGYSVSSAGDVNGDGKDDMIVEAPFVSSSSGEAYVVFGASSFGSGSFNIASLNGANGFKMAGLVSNGYFGYSVSSAGDFNGDGKDDIMVGAPGLSKGAGEAYVIFGASSFGSGSFNIAALNGANGFKMAGLVLDGHFGFSISSAGDINRDGKDDIIVGADNAAGGEGEAYVIFGASFCSTTDFIMTPITQTHIATHPTYTPVLPDATHTGASFPIYAIAVIAVGAIGIATAVTGTMYLKMAGLYCHSQSIQEVHEDYILG